MPGMGVAAGGATGEYITGAVYRDVNVPGVLGQDGPLPTHVPRVMKVPMQAQSVP